MQSDYWLQFDLRFCRSLESKRAKFEIAEKWKKSLKLIISTLKAIRDDFQGRAD